MSLTEDKITVLSIGDAYKHADTFNALLLKIGVDAAGQARIRKDGFTSMELLAFLFKNYISIDLHYSQIFSKNGFGGS